MNVRTPDPNPGWLSEEDLFEARGRLPMVYVEAVPVRLDPLGYVNEVGTLLQADDDGTMVRSLVSGRVIYRETIRAALLRHMEKDLGPLAFPQLPISPVPFTVAEYFPAPSQTGFTDERQHAVSLAYVIPVTGECEPRQDALELTWMTPDEVLSPGVQLEFSGGRGGLIRQALAFAGVGS
ncbi:NUDIX hydrolase family protein [Pseudarthrobacter sp. SL88]|uniref:NUDIX hydrolase family protein n=1 Tax=Micrococcaceae TaxID=1268 RepID=UPI0006F494F8|nr:MULTISPECIES: NUDIX hydrolase family protein [Micrococcaceae]KQQ90059.1 ADP-ribose pyrophosphatase [Arthrobacter sp. Leaf137]MCT9625718.1 NUDIX hydrolase family protein [Pseudarthrobacter equi]MCY1675979.1 NUDIX hydrolase family protein [Pseudarthrobacter sp. SL88]MDQ1053295.1 ADP-ribose pyrophosphatase YjhB (NUDIX family) [Arthrobacter sp. SORGH_AS_0212]